MVYIIPMRLKSSLFSLFSLLLLSLRSALLLISLYGCGGQKLKTPGQEQTPLQGLLKIFLEKNSHHGPFLQRPWEPWKRMLQASYRHRNYRPYWVDETNGLNQSAATFLRILER